MSTVPYTLRIRSGCEGGGKGALVQTDKAGTLATNNDQYLFAPITDTHILDDQGGSVINVRDDGKAPTLRAETHGHLPKVMVTEAVGADLYNGTVTGDVTATVDTHARLVNGPTNVIYAVENHPADSRVGIDENGTVQTLPSRMGTGGGNVPMVMQPKPEERPMAAFSFDSLASNSMRSKNPHSGCREVDIAKTLDTTDPNPCKNQGGLAIVEEHPVICLQGNGIDRADTAGCNGAGWREDQAPTLCTTHGGEPAVVYAMDRAAYNQGWAEERVGALNCMHDQQAVTYPTQTRYIVRRLTPTECARLQGFADRWGDIDPKDSLTEDEYRFWLDVRNTHARINGKKEQDYTAKQMLTWYNKLQTDAAEYKMWGNGIALPTALYCLQGIADALAKAEEDDTWML